MTATRTDSPTTSTETRTSQVFIRTNSEEKAMAEAAAEYYGCSQAEAGRQLYEAWFQNTFGDVDPELVADTNLDAEDLQNLAAKDLSEDELHAELRRHAASDDSDTTPTSYTATVVPAELERSGPELDYEDLREAVQDPEDGGYWSDNLEIHPDRVGNTTLRANHLVTSRVLAAMARSCANEGVFHEDPLTDLVQQYCLHLTDRFNADRGKQYIIETYKNNVKRLLWTHPRPSSKTLFTSKESYYSALPGLMNDCETTLNGFADIILQREECLETDLAGPLTASLAEVEDLEDWYVIVGEALEFVATTRNIISGITDPDQFLEQAGDDAFDFGVRPEVDGPFGELAKSQKEFMNLYETNLHVHVQEKIEENHVSPEVQNMLSRE